MKLTSRYNFYIIYVIIYIVMIYILLNPDFSHDEKLVMGILYIFLMSFLKSVVINETKTYLCSLITLILFIFFSTDVVLDFIYFSYVDIFNLVIKISIDIFCLITLVWISYKILIRNLKLKSIKLIYQRYRNFLYNYKFLYVFIFLYIPTIYISINQNNGFILGMFNIAILTILLEFIISNLEGKIRYHMYAVIANTLTTWYGISILTDTTKLSTLSDSVIIIKLILDVIYFLSTTWITVARIKYKAEPMIWKKE